MESNRMNKIKNLMLFIKQFYGMTYEYLITDDILSRQRNPTLKNSGFTC